MRTRWPARTWLVELSLAAVAALLGGFLLVETVAENPDPKTATQVVLGVLALAGLVRFRRSHPAALTLALIPAAIVSALAMGAMPVALFAVALHRPARVAVALAGLHTMAVAVTYRIVISDTREYREAMITIILVYVTLLAVAMQVRSQRLLVRSWADRAAAAEEGQRLRIEEARHGERERIAREMHDVLAHRISLLAVHAGALQVRRDAEPRERQAAGVIRQCAYDAMEDLRQVIGMLRDPDTAGEPDRPQPTFGDLPALVQQSVLAGATVTHECRVDDPATVPDGLGRHAYRIVQEALTNARKHAPGAPVRVTVAGCRAGGLTVEVVNPLDAAGAGAAMPGAGAGLVGLRERVDLAGGRLQHGPDAAGDFRLRAWLPWRP